MSLSDHPLVELCGVTMGDPTVLTDNCEWLATGPMDGWDSPTIRNDILLPTGRHGGVQAEQLYGPREIIFTGAVFGDTREDAWAAWYRVTGAMPGVGASGQLIVYEDVPLGLTVRQFGKAAAPPPVNGWFEFTLSLVALDPFKRTLSATTVSVAAGDTESLTNDGTAPAYLTVEATGSGTVQLRQDDSGQVLRSKASVSSGTTFDGTAKRVTSSGGTTLLGVMDNPSEWLSIPPLSTVTVTNQGTAPVDVTFYHSYA